MSTASAPLTEEAVREMSMAELRLNAERCTRLVAHASLLQRLPDGGANIRLRHSLFTAELQRRETARVADTSSSSSNTEDKSGATAVDVPSAQEERRRANEAAQLAETVESPVDVARAMGDKYRHQRVPVEETVRSMYEGAVSEAELQRIIQSVPAGYFLTYDETCAMEQKLAKEARREELQKLAAESARQSRLPQ